MFSFFFFLFVEFVNARRQAIVDDSDPDPSPRTCAEPALGIALSGRDAALKEVFPTLSRAEHCSERQERPSST